jgi:predicted P-loop ATPase
MIGKRKFNASDLFALCDKLTEASKKGDEAMKSLSYMESFMDDITNNCIIIRKQSNWTGDRTVMALQAIEAISKAEAEKAEMRKTPTAKDEEVHSAPVKKVRQIEERDPHIIEVNAQLQSKPTAEDVKKTSSEIFKMEWLMNNRYELRHNEITNQTEYRLLNSNEPYAKITERVIHSMCTYARKNGVNVWDNDIRRHVESTFIADFHPMKDYMESLPKWDGKDRVTPLAERVSKSEFWVKHFHTWMRGLTAQWLGRDTLHGNSVAPILISKKQGRQKSTFCKLLLPDELQPYYLDRLNINSTARAEEKLTEFALINLDEIDKYSAKGMASLKNLMQMATVNTKKAYQRGLSNLPRTTSFIATSNRRDLLTDPTGSRRFICIEVDKKIDCSPIDHAQIYAQLKEEIGQGMRYWYTEEEEAEIMAHNAAYQRNTIEEDVFDTLFRKPVGNEKTIKLSAREIYDEMKKTDKEAMKGVKESKIWGLLKELDYHKEHYEDGNKYNVVKK